MAKEAACSSGRRGLLIFRLQYVAIAAIILSLLPGSQALSAWSPLTFGTEFNWPLCSFDTYQLQEKRGVRGGSQPPVLRSWQERQVRQARRLRLGKDQGQERISWAEGISPTNYLNQVLIIMILGIVYTVAAFIFTIFYFRYIDSLDNILASISN